MRAIYLLTVTVFAFSVSCKKEAASPASTTHTVTSVEESNIDLQGAGATFPYPLYSKWIAEYQKINPRVRINYQSIGSGGGIRQIIERTVDFGASDAPMTDEELGKAPTKIFHIPMTIGAVVITYHLAGLSGGLKLTPDIVAGIFLGEIKIWNAPSISKINPGVKLPESAISVVTRSDGSGTTAVFTEYLSRVSPAWKQKVGAGKSVRFPSGLGAKGNEGVAGQVKTTPGTIGYVELAYAMQTGLSYASIQNRAGTFVEPSQKNIAEAAASVAGAMPEDLRMSIVDASGPAAYPISAFTYILLYEEQSVQAKGMSLVKFLWWATHDGQAFGPPLHYAPLPREVLPKIEEKLHKLRTGDQLLLVKAP